jgi:VWFA-related protein
MRSFSAGTLVFILCLTCLPALSQEISVVRIGVAVLRSGANKVSVTEARDRLVKALNQHKPDKKWKVAVQAVGLEASEGNKAIAEAKEKNCQFVLLSHLTDLLTSEKTVPAELEAGMNYVPVVAARVAYQLMRVIDGAEYAIGSVKGEESSSNREAVLQAMGSVAADVVAELRKGGNVPHGEAVPAESATASPASGPREEVFVGPDFCKWLPTSISHAQALRSVCEYAISLPQMMPNFICDQETSRYRGENRVPRDLITALVRYEDGSESYSEIKLNGKPAPSAITESPGLWSTGEFGSNLRAIFNLHNQPAFEFSGESALGGHAAWVFTYGIVRQNDPLWRLRTEDQVVAPPYGGELWVDQKTGNLLRFRSVARDIPPTFPTQSAELQTDYDNVAFGDGTSFLLPVQATVATKYRGEESTRNVLQFRNCHKFRAKAHMVLNVPAGAVETPPSAGEGTSSAELERELEENNKIYAILREEAVREDAARLEIEQRQELDAATVEALWKLAALEKERQRYMTRESAAAAGASRPSAKEAVTTLKVSVKLVPVSVVLRDARGHAVGNLRKEDFRLFDNGKPQVITSFFVEKEAASDKPEERGAEENRAADSAAALAENRNPPARAERYVAYVFDDVHATTAHLAEAGAAATRHSATLRSEDRVAIFTTSREIWLGFTADREKLGEALRDLKPHPILPGWNCPPVSYYMADLIVNQGDQDALDEAASEAIACAFAGVGSCVELTQAQHIAMAESLEVLNVGNREARQALRLLHDVIQTTKAMPGRRSIVLVSLGFLTLTPDLHQEVMDLVDRALQADIVVNTLDVRGLYTVGVDGSKNLGLVRLRLDREEADAQSGVMFELADGTGGTYFHAN